MKYRQVVLNKITVSNAASLNLGSEGNCPPQTHLLKTILNDHLETPSQKLTCFKGWLAFLFDCNVSSCILPVLVKLLSTSYVHQ